MEAEGPMSLSRAADRAISGCLATSLIGLTLTILFTLDNKASGQAQSGAKSSSNQPLGKGAAATSTVMAKAIQLYQARRYAEASGLFGQAIKSEGAGASGYLYLAHCQYGLGHIKESVPYYRYVRDTYKDSPESKIAQQYLAKLDPTSAAGGAGAAKGAAASASPSLNSSDRPAASGNLLDRIEIVRAVNGHPALDKLTINTIKEDLKKLPKPVQKILIDGEIKFCLTTTLIDKFPAMGYQEGRGYDGHTYKACPGMFWTDTVYICERTVNEGNDEVSGQIMPGQMTQTFYHEIGHALDACLGDYSTKDDYRHAYYLDLARIPSEAAGRLAYYMQKSDAGQVESCGEITAVCLGSGERTGEDIKTYFPLTMAFIKKKLNIDEIMKASPSR
jgi:hypothetical protein